MWITGRTGMVLPCSRHMFVCPVLHADQQAWTETHVVAFRFFGGVPRRLVPDNLKTGVSKPGLYDPKTSKTYAELATHYGVLADPARASKPKDKPVSTSFSPPGRPVKRRVCTGPGQVCAVPRSHAGGERAALGRAGLAREPPVDEDLVHPVGAWQRSGVEPFGGHDVRLDGGGPGARSGGL